MRTYLELFLAILAALTVWSAWAYVSPLANCRWCKGTGKHKLSGRRRYGKCWNPRCQRGSVWRPGARTVHRIVRALITYSKNRSS